MSVDPEELRRREPEWDELRERRVLGRVLAARSGGERRRRRVRLGVAFGAGVAVAAAALAWLRAPEPSAGGDVVATVAVEGEAGASRLARLVLRDGSEVYLAGAADVRVESQSEDAVRIAQLAGEARYVVSHRPERAFVVALEDVEVRVRGTQFWVRRGESEVEVEVQEGRVEVARGHEASLLGAGEALRVRMRGAARAEAEAATEAGAAIETEAEAGGGTEPGIEIELGAEAAIGRELQGELGSSRGSEVRVTAGERRAPESLESLIARADEARRAGRLDEAVRALRAAVSLEPRDPRVATAYFTLGRVERSRGRDAAAAQAFEASLERAPHGALAEDALAEAAVSWSAAGRRDRARAAAERYLERHPAGLYADRVRHLAE